MKEAIHLCVTLDKNYIPQLRVLLASLLRANAGERFCVHVLNVSLTDAQLAAIGEGLPPRCEINGIRADEALFKDAPVSERYPREMYLRLLAAQLLPACLERAIYLDPDIVALAPLRPLYTLEMGEHFFAAASHLHHPLFVKFNEARLRLPEDKPYINSGVMLMNLGHLRREQQPEEVLRYIEVHRGTLLLPDQDVLNALYARRTLPIDPLYYNLSDKYLTLYNLRHPGAALDTRWVREHTVFIHYCGRNKPWRSGYRGVLGGFYREAEALLAGG